MRFAFALYRYFAHGGLQRDMFRILQEALSRGHKADLFVHEYQAEDPALPGLTIHRLPVSGWSNHARMASFEKAVRKALPETGPYDCTAAFSRIPGCDLYFAADNCLAAEWREKHSLLTLKILPRYRTFLRQEAEICRDPDCRIFSITPRQKKQYQLCYSLPDTRFIELPPGMNPDCRRPENAGEIRSEVRRKMGIPESETILISVGQDMRRKGSDRAILALGALPEEMRRKTRLLLVGQEPFPAIRNTIRSAGVTEKVQFLGVRDDVPELLLASDLMIHPARSESAGSVLIEGIASGLPVLATALCGFSTYVSAVDPACVVPDPFRQEALNRALLSALENLDSLKARTIAYGAKADFYSRASVAVDAMETAGRRKSPRKN